MPVHRPASRWGSSPPRTFLQSKLCNNISSLAAAAPQWEFNPIDPNLSQFTANVSWVWVLPEQGPDAPNGVPEGSGTFTTASAAAMEPGGSVESLCTAPFPFSSWEIPSPPIVAAVTPSRAARGGGTFTIVGDNLFPTLVDAVLLGGNPLNSANFSVGFDDNGNGKVDVHGAGQRCARAKSRTGWDNPRCYVGQQRHHRHHAISGGRSAVGHRPPLPMVASLGHTTGTRSPRWGQCALKSTLAGVAALFLQAQLKRVSAPSDDRPSGRPNWPRHKGVIVMPPGL